MGTAFSLFVAIILIIALLNRRRQNKAWVREERREESGAWVDKRAGERGTYGSLDAEMEQERRQLAKQGRTNDLSRRLREYAFEHYPGFHTLSDAQIKAYTVFLKKQVGDLQTVIEKLLKGTAPAWDDQPASETPHSLALKKMILDFSFEQYPALLEMEIEVIKQFDRYVANLSAVLVDKKV